MSTGTVRARHAALALMAATALLAWCVPAAAASSLQPWPARLAPPALKLNDLDGREWDIAHLRGKVVVLNFWASWCAPCIDEIPLLNELATEAATAGELVVLGVNFKESATVIRRFSQEHAIRYPVLQDRAGDYFKKWSNGILPTTVLIDRDGRARWRVVGELDRSDGKLRDVLQEMLEGRGRRAGTK
ncbi:MAG TPA: TlpA disulfide reductase family protein [Noviherbaspirillum sp.]|nr:TlpA disulfide reductase family protein [Noviherbaspirillum sp.]